MNRRYLYILTLFTVLSACTENREPGLNEGNNASDSGHVDTSAITSNSEVQNNIKFRADSFVQLLLDTNALLWTFEPQDEDVPRYFGLFKQEGIKKRYAYSDKNYPELSKPTHYRHFLLFLIEYNNIELAKESYMRFVTDSETDKNNKELSTDDASRISLIYGLSKYGGLVGRKDNFLFSLRQSRSPDYKQKFIETMFEQSDSGLTILDAEYSKLKYVKRTVF